MTGLPLNSKQYRGLSLYERPPDNMLCPHGFERVLVVADSFRFALRAQVSLCLCVVLFALVVLSTSAVYLCCNGVNVRRKCLGRCNVQFN